jgi:hypothetical protein
MAQVKIKAVRVVSWTMPIILYYAQSHVTSGASHPYKPSEVILENGFQSVVLESDKEYIFIYISQLIRS